MVCQVGGRCADSQDRVHVRPLALRVLPSKNLFCECTALECLSVGSVASPYTIYVRMLIPKKCPASVVAFLEYAAKRDRKSYDAVKQKFDLYWNEFAETGEQRPPRKRKAATAATQETASAPSPASAATTTTTVSQAPPAASTPELCEPRSVDAARTVEPAQEQETRNDKHGREKQRDGSNSDDDEESSKRRRKDHGARERTVSTSVADLRRSRQQLDEAFWVAKVCMQQMRLVSQTPLEAAVDRLYHIGAVCTQRAAELGA